MADIVITSAAGDPHVTALGIRDDTSSRGVDLAGALMTLTYVDGTQETLTWAALDAYTQGGATGEFGTVYFDYDVHELSVTKRLASFEIDLAPASSVFDITTPMDADPLGGSTPGSNNGFPFKLTTGFEDIPGEIEVSYSGIVNLAGQAARDDLYTTMRVDLTGLSGGGLIGDLGWNSDIDTMRIAGDLVPAENALSGGALNDSLGGTSASELLAGLGGDDTLSGAGGNDLLIGGAGDDLLIGGLGLDTAGFAGLMNEYTLQISADHPVTVTQRKAAGEGTDSLIEVEQIRFAGGDTINLDKIDGISSLETADVDLLIEVYIAYFNRAPDALGLYFWGKALADGIPLDEIARLFLDQDETRALYPASLTNAEFAEQVYQNVLGRTPDAEGLAFWVSTLDDGAVGRDAFILEVIRGAKAAPAPDASPDFIALQNADRSYLATKTDIGTYFAAIRGLSDVDEAQAAMALFQRDMASSVDAAIAFTDDVYATASADADGALLLQLVGVVDDPFAMN